MPGVPLTTTPHRIADHSASWRPDWPLDVRRVLSRDRRGTGDPTLRYAEDGVWRTTTTPDGPATVRLTGSPRRCGSPPGARVRSGPAPPCPAGSARRTGPTGSPPTRTRSSPRLHRSTPWLRLGSTGRTWDALVPAVLEQ
ncbi:hypothetical protein A7K94_0208045, partial [Modestobacter sp. VKM Ac-2676]